MWITALGLLYSRISSNLAGKLPAAEIVLISGEPQTPRIIKFKVPRIRILRDQGAFKIGADQ